MRFSDLYDAKVRTRGGDLIGRVHEVTCEAGRVTSLGVGAGSLLQRLTGGRKGRRIAWDKVIETRPGAVIVED